MSEEKIVVITEETKKAIVKLQALRVQGMNQLTQLQMEIGGIDKAANFLLLSHLEDNERVGSFNEETGEITVSKNGTAANS